MSSQSHWTEVSCSTSITYPLYFMWVRDCKHSHRVPSMVSNAMQGSAPGRMKALLVSHGSDLYLYGGMPHTAFTSSRNAAAANFAYPEGETLFMKLSPASGNKWQSVSCEGAVPESRTRIHSGHAGQSHSCALSEHLSHFSSNFTVSLTSTLLPYRFSPGPTAVTERNGKFCSDKTLCSCLFACSKSYNCC